MATFPELKDRAILITGGANGIGEAMVRAFHAQGSRVFLCDTDETRGTALARELGPRAHFHPLDLAGEDAIRHWVQEVRAQAPVLHAVINNAARDPRIPFLETTARQWDELFAVNLRAAFVLARECVPAMPAGGTIINVSSITFYNTPPQLVAYVATKGGVLGFTRCLARELGPVRIRVNCISPGWVFTERQIREHLTPENRRLVQERQCIPDFIQPAEIAAVALFLASDLSSALTGQELLVDRGWAHS